MGRDYWYWRRAAAAKPKPSTTTSTSSPRPAPKTTLPRCISLVFHLFDSHRLRSPFNHQTSSRSSSGSNGRSRSSSSSEPRGIAGTEAPRNSLELQEKEASTSASFTSTTQQQEILNIPPMGIQIKTSGGISSKVGDPNNETPRTNTPTLVARLMGLDLLPPETHSPSFQAPKALRSHTTSFDGDMRGGTRSLPETPRTSAARRSDVDHHHRLSLQINKENMESMISRLSSSKMKDLKHECEVVKEAKLKQSVGRKVGMNITNTVHNREGLVSHFKYKKIDDSSIVKHSTHSSSKSSTNHHNPQHPKSSSPRIRKQSSHKLQVFEEQDEQHKQQGRSASKCKKGSNKKFSSRLKKPQQASEIIRNKKEEPFVRPSSTANRVNNPDKKCRKTPLSNDLLNSKITTIVPVKKYTFTPSIKIPQKQVSDAQRPKHSSQTLSSSTNGDRHNTAICTADDEAEYEYIARILRRTGINKHTQVSISAWFSPSHPLDPSIFHYLEHFITSSTHDHKTKWSELRHRCNRKLLFHLVDGLLAEILKPYFNKKPWVIYGFSSMDGSQLIDTLCSRIRSFPRSDCRVLEDIDALIGIDLPDIKLQSVMVYEEEGEGVVSEVERYILETLIHEMADSISLRFI